MDQLTITYYCRLEVTGTEIVARMHLSIRACMNAHSEISTNNCMRVYIKLIQL